MRGTRRGLVCKRGLTCIQLQPGPEFGMCRSHKAALSQSGSQSRFGPCHLALHLGCSSLRGRPLAKLAKAQGPHYNIHPAWERQTPGSSGRPASLRSTSTDTSLEQVELLMVAITHGDAFPQLQTRPCKGGCALDDAQSCEKHPTQQPRESDAAAI